MENNITSSETIVAKAETEVQSPRIDAPPTWVPPPPKPKKVRTIDKRDFWFLLITAVLGILFCEFILFEGWGLSVTVYTALFYAAVFVYLKARGISFPKKSLFLLIPIALTAMCFLLFDNGLLHFFNICLLFGLIAMQLASMAQVRLYGSYSPGMFMDFIQMVFVFPYCNLPAVGQAVNGIAKNKQKKVMGNVLVGVLCAVPLLLVIGLLLTSADAAFENVMVEIGKFFGERFWEYFFKVIVGLWIGCMLFSFFYSLRYKDTKKGLHSKLTADRVRFISPVGMATVLTLLGGLFLLYVGAQLRYIGSGLPVEALTYADYAKRGFWELQAVAVLNLLVYLFAGPFTKVAQGKSHNYLKVVTAALSVFTLLLIGSAFYKMLLYVDEYGLTLLRVYSTWFMVVLAVVFVGTLIKVFSPKVSLIKISLIAGIGLYLALNYMNVDWSIAKYNIERSRDNPKQLDVLALYELSDACIPTVADLLDDPVFRAKHNEIKEFLNNTARYMPKEKWQAWNLVDQLARNTLVARGYSSQLAYKNRTPYRYRPDEDYEEDYLE